MGGCCEPRSLSAVPCAEPPALLSCGGRCCCCCCAGEVATVWAFNYFFYNKKMKRILYIGVKALSKTAAEEEKVSWLAEGRLCLQGC